MIVNLHETIDRMKREISTDIVNHFGGHTADGGMPGGFMQFFNDAQDAVDTWLKNGRL